MRNSIDISLQLSPMLWQRSSRPDPFLSSAPSRSSSQHTQQYRDLALLLSYIKKRHEYNNNLRPILPEGSLTPRSISRRSSSSEGGTSEQSGQGDGCSPAEPTTDTDVQWKRGSTARKEPSLVTNTGHRILVSFYAVTEEISKNRTA